MEVLMDRRTATFLIAYVLILLVGQIAWLIRQR
jgi:hypothetical protein